MGVLPYLILDDGDGNLLFGVRETLGEPRYCISDVPGVIDESNANELSRALPCLGPRIFGIMTIERCRDECVAVDVQNTCEDGDLLF